MLCSKCNTENNIEANFCAHCGSPLKEKPPQNKRKVSYIYVSILVLIICFSAVYYFYQKKDQDFSSHDHAVEKSLEREDDNQVASDGSGDDAGDTSEKSEETIKDDDVVEVPAVIFGTVLIKSGNGSTINKIPAALAGDLIVALPAVACFGGKNWTFISNDQEIRITEGVWKHNDEIGLWFLEDRFSVTGPDLFPCTSGEPVSWFSLEDNTKLEPFIPSIVETKGFFSKCKLPESSGRYGVFIQNSQTVGWTFGAIPGEGFLWAGLPGTVLTPDNTIENFYHATSSGGREEHFQNVYDQGEATHPSVLFKDFVAGFRLEKKLLPENTPSLLKTDAIVKKMLQLISILKKEKLFHSIAEPLDNTVIVEAGSINFLVEAVNAYSEAYSFKTALDLLESSDDEVVQSVDDKNRLKNLQLELYKNILSELIRKHDYSYSSSIFKKAIKVFPEDFEIHLLGVETELIVGKWKEAKRLLLMRDYPAILSAKASMLKYQIKELEREDGKLVIRFTPESKHIQTTAKLSPKVTQKSPGKHTPKVNQRFLVDTGATMVTIPTATAEKLLMEYDSNTKRIHVATAGGIITTWEVIIPCIEINNHKEYNVRAYVLDMAGDPAEGLLGQNYLNRFQVEIDNEKGLLLLKPR